MLHDSTYKYLRQSKSQKTENRLLVVASGWEQGMGFGEALSHGYRVLVIKNKKNLQRFTIQQCQISLVAQTVKYLSTMRETWVRSLGREVPQRRKRQPTPVLLPRKSHGRRNLVSMGSQSWTRLNDFTSLLHCSHS